MAMAALLPAWVRALWEPTDIARSRELVKKLNLPESTAQFVIALRPADSPDAVVYVLSSLYLSEKAASDARELIAAANPKAVVSLVDVEALVYYKEEENLASLAGESFSVPTSSLGVIQENLVRDPEIVPYGSRARIQVSNSIFGTGFFGDVFEAKQAAAKLDASFHYIDFPYRAVSDYEADDPPVEEAAPGENSQGASHRSQKDVGIDNLKGEDSAATRRATQGFKSFVGHTPVDVIRKWRESCSVALALSFGHKSSQALSSSSTERNQTSDVPSEDTPQSEETVPTPEFARPLLPVLSSLTQLYQNPALEQALQCTYKMIQDVEIGREVDVNDLLEATHFRIALEMIRVHLNNAVSAPTTKIPKRTAADFHNLSYEDKCHAVLAQSLQKKAKESGTVVAVMDVNRVPGIRQHWNQPIPEEVIPLIDECYISMDAREEVSILDTLFSTGSDKNKPAEGDQEKKAAVVVGAGAAAAVGLVYLPNWAAPLTPLLKLASVKVSTLFKLGFLNSKRVVALSVAKGLPGASKVVLPSVKASAAKSASASAAKAAVTAERARAAAQGLVSALQRQTLQAIRTTFYSAMRQKQGKPVGRSPWMLFGSSVLAGGSILLYGDTVERAIGALPSGPSVARLGRGLESLSRAMEQMHVNWDEVYHGLYNMK